MDYTYSRTAWLSRPDSVLDIDFDNPESVGSVVNLAEPFLDMSCHGWIKVGDASITISAVESYSSIAVSAAEAARTKLRERDAEHECNRMALLALISKLESLEYKP